MKGPANMDEAQDSGFTLVEMLVSMMVMMVLAGVAMSTVVGASKAVKTSTQLQGTNEEARGAINRMARDIRQASSIVAVLNPDGPAFATTSSSIVAIRIQADFDGDGCIDGVMPTPALTTPCTPYYDGNPEDVTYCYAFDSKQLYVIDNKATGVTPISSTTTSCTGGQPLLAGNVNSFKIEYRSNQYRYDSNGDGVTTWRELDAAAPPIGNNSGTLDTVELANVDSVVLNVSMKVGGHPQDYRTQVDLRNRSI